MPKKKKSKPAKSRKSAASSRKGSVKKKSPGKTRKAAAKKKSAPKRKPVVVPSTAYPKPILRKPAGTLPAPRGILLGEVEDFFSRIDVIALTLKDSLSIGDSVPVRGHTTNLIQRVDSMQIDHVPVQKAGKSDSVGIKVTQKCRKGDQVFRQ